MFSRTDTNGINRSATTNGNRRVLRDVTNSALNDESKKRGEVNVNKRSVSIVNENRAVLPVRQHSVQNIQGIENGAILPARQQSLVTAPTSNLTGLQNKANQEVAPIRREAYQYSGHVDDIDERDADDPLCATDYVQDMYQFFRMKELTTSVRPIYMENQTHINERMRSILVDWLVEVHLKFKLVPETLYLTVNLIDRYLERREVSRPKLQLVGVTALLIASKYEEIYPPELRDLVYICDRAYSRDEILGMEETVLKTLEYKITIHSAHAFLVRYLKAAHADKRIVQLSCYILDGTLQSYALLHYLPSQLAAAAVLIARRCVGRNSWSPTLLRYAQYCEEDILPVARAVLAEKSSVSTEELRAVNKKYSSSRYGEVARMEILSDF